jgi:hypothetical protein
MTFVTLFSLFGDDFRWGFFTKKQDMLFDGFICLCLWLFSVEIIVYSIVNKGYFGSFYFWLDIISTLSLISDVNFLMN